MHVFAKLAAAAAFAGLAATALPASAQATDLTLTVSASNATPQSHGYRRGYEPHHRGHRWNGPEGHFVVYARACPDLREDRRDRRVIDCPDRAWDYIPSRRELRAGRTGERLRPDRAYLDRRTGGYYVETRWGAVPVQVVHGRRWHDRHGRGHGRGHRRDHYWYGRH